MSGRIAELGIAVDSGDAVQAATDLDKLTEAGIKAEKAADGVTTGFKKTADAADKLAEAEAKAAQATEDAKARLLETAQTSLKNSEYYQRLTSSVTSTAGAMDINRDSTASLLALQKRMQAESDALVGTTQQEAKAAKEAAAATGVQAEGLDNLLNKLNPTRKAQADLNADLATLSAGFKAGKLDLDRYTAEVGKVNAQLRGLDGSGSFADKLSLGTKGARENFLQLGNAIAEGNFRIAAHNILEIGTNAGASALQFAALAAPVLAVAAALGLVAYGYAQGSKEQDEYNKQLILTGNYAGTSAGQLADVARQVSATVGTTGQAAAALAQLAGSGKIASGSFQEITEAALEMEKATGKSVDSTIAEFVKIADDPVAAAKSLNDQYHFLTASVYSQIVALKEQGDTIGATKLLTDTYADTIKDRSSQIIQNLSLWERAWKGIGEETKKTLDALNNVGREESAQKQITDLTQKLAYLKSTIGTGFEDGDAKQRIADIEQELTFRKQQLDTERAIGSAHQLEGETQKAGLEAAIRLKAQNDANLTPLEKRNKLQKEYLRDVEALRKANPNDENVTPAAVAKGLANIAEKNKDPKGPANQLNLTGFNDAQNNLKSITGYYQNLEKELDSAQKSGLVSAESYSSQRVAIVEQEKSDVTAAYEAEISALQAVRDKASTTGQQRIQLDEKIADARASMVKAQKDADSQLEVLANNEKGRIDKQTRSIAQYVQALDQQQKALELAGQRAVLGVGRGDRQNALNAELNSQQDRFAQQSLDLANQKSDPSRNMSEEEFAKKSQALADANKKATDQIRQNYADVQTAQGDWTNGASAAWENYLDSARDVAGQTKSLFTNAFSSMEDAVANFALTGKLSFADFTKSILADLARIAARQASSALLSSLFGIGLSFFSGGGGNGLAPGSAGAVSSNLGASQAGYSSTFFPQAKGGAWLDGVQMFANGGAFANGIVSSPTAFGMAGGGTGVMGEAGPEAIVPLARTSSGALGIRSVGGGGSNIQINAPINIVTQDRSSEGMQLDQQALQQNLQQQMQAAAEKAVADSWRAGGVSYRNTNRRG